MATHSSLLVNGKAIKAAPGETLLEAALSGRIVIPHDCCTGQCDSCRVRVYAGEVDAQGTAKADTVLACLARVTGHAVIEFDAVPDVVRRSGSVASIVSLSPDIVEVALTLASPFSYLPGQYVSCAFAGFPARDYSPTLRGDGSGEPTELVLHIRRVADGAVSSQLGERIREGHKVMVRGPFGSAFHRSGPGRLILVSSGTGWAPIWAVARASRYKEPDREMAVIAGARDPANLYMRDALAWLSGTGVGRAVATSSAGTPADGLVGRPTAHLPGLRPTDTIYAAGAPSMVAAVQFMAAAAGATCYADPFVASSRKRSLRHKLADLVLARWRGQAMAPVAATRIVG